MKLEGPGEVSLFVYDNNSFVVHSFLDEEVTINVLLDRNVAEITDIASGEKIQGILREAPVFRNRKLGVDTMVFEVTIKPHSFRAFVY